MEVVVSSVNYSLNNKGVRLINSKDAWVIRGKKLYLNPKYKFVGKVDMSMPNMIVTASDKSKPKYRGDVHELNKVCKGQMIDFFYNDDGKRNRRNKAYLVIEKK